jgi:hypothetical protein
MHKKFGGETKNMLDKMLPHIVLMSVSAAAVLAMAVGAYLAPERVQRVVREQGPLADPVMRAFMNPDEPAAPVASKAAQWVGLCPAYAAITVAGFRAQVMNDPQLMAHYGNFDWNRAEIFENQEDSFSSVLYKKNGGIYWTRKQLRIRKGEKILTDGKVLIRTYCCNQITLVPAGPFLPPDIEPPPEEIQPPEAPAMPEFPFALTPPTLDIPPSLGKFTPRPPTSIAFARKERSPRGRIPVPEPGTFILIVSGLGALVLHHRGRRKMVR